LNAHAQNPNAMLGAQDILSLSLAPRFDVNVDAVPSANKADVETWYSRLSASVGTIFQVGTGATKVPAEATSKATAAVSGAVDVVIEHTDAVLTVLHPDAVIAGATGAANVVIEHTDAVIAGATQAVSSAVKAVTSQGTSSPSPRPTTAASGSHDEVEACRASPAHFDASPCGEFATSFDNATSFTSVFGYTSPVFNDVAALDNIRAADQQGCGSQSRHRSRPLISRDAAVSSATAAAAMGPLTRELRTAQARGLVTQSKSGSEPLEETPPKALYSIETWRAWRELEGAEKKAEQIQEVPWSLQKDDFNTDLRASEAVEVQPVDKEDSLVPEPFSSLQISWPTVTVQEEEDQWPTVTVQKEDEDAMEISRSLQKTPSLASLHPEKSLEDEGGSRAAECEERWLVEQPEEEQPAGIQGFVRRHRCTQGFAALYTALLRLEKQRRMLAAQRFVLRREQAALCLQRFERGRQANDLYLRYQQATADSAPESALVAAEPKKLTKERSPNRLIVEEDACRGPRKLSPPRAVKAFAEVVFSDGTSAKYRFDAHGHCEMELPASALPTTWKAEESDDTAPADAAAGSAPRKNCMVGGVLSTKYGKTCTGSVIAEASTCSSPRVGESGTEESTDTAFIEEHLSVPFHVSYMEASNHFSSLVRELSSGLGNPFFADVQY